VLLASLLSTTFSVHEAKASDIIYIRADGSIHPPTANITTDDSVTYTFTDNNYDSIVVERDNVMVDGTGHTLQGTGVARSRGMDLTGRINVTIKNIKVQDFDYGIWLNSSSGNTISGSTITSNGAGILLIANSDDNSVSGNTVTANFNYGVGLSSSSSNSVSGNTIRGNVYWGISLGFSSGNNFSGNTITDNGAGIYFGDRSGNNIISGNDMTNNGYGIALSSASGFNTLSGNTIANNGRGIILQTSSDNTITGNTIANNSEGIRLESSSGNMLCHNDFIDNEWQVYDASWDAPWVLPSANVWNDDYPSGGNYWSNHTGGDAFKGLGQNETGSDGILDQPYMVYTSNQDKYPLAKPYGGPAGDVDGDRDVDVFDIVRIAGTYGSEYPDTKYNRLCDVDLDGDIDLFDVVKAAVNYGKHW
jgi:parallel beta-helix repeat protein